MTPFYEVIKRPLITEKSVILKDGYDRYCFEVSLNATKPQIKDLVQTHFKVKVKDVRTLVVRGHMRRIGRYQGKKANWKKAIVTLEKGQKLEIFEVK